VHDRIWREARQDLPDVRNVLCLETCAMPQQTYGSRKETPFDLQIEQAESSYVLIVRRRPVFRSGRSSGENAHRVAAARESDRDLAAHLLVPPVSDRRVEIGDKQDPHN
jgi:hypothetical protein